MKKQIITLMLVVSTIITIVPFSVSAATNGLCGESLTWSLDDSGTLTISGEGEMNDYNDNFINEERIIDTPWFDERNQIKSVIIEEGVTRIGEYAFCDCENLINVTFPNSLIELGNGAFNKTNLAKVSIPDTAKKIDWNCFAYCYNLKEIYIGKNIEYIGDHSFAGNKSLTFIKIPESVKYIGGTAFTESNLNTIYYEGSKEQWDNIDKSNTWDFGIKNREKLVINFDYKENGKVTDYTTSNSNVLVQENVSVYINGKKIEFDVPAQIIEGRTMVPLRGVCEALGLSVNFNDQTKQITITDNNSFQMVNILGNKEFGIVENNAFRSVESDVPTMTINGRTLVPVRLVSESLGCNVEWNGSTYSVYISTKNSNSKFEYYNNSDVLTYTTITGVALKDTATDENGTIYKYPYTNIGEYNEFSDYIRYLVENGWVQTNKTENSDMLIYWFVKDNVQIQIGYVVSPDEIWLSIINKQNNFTNNNLSNNNPASTKKYYTGTGVPNYTTVTEVPLMYKETDEDGTIYKYKYTTDGEYPEMVDYIIYLEKNGWREVSKDKLSTILMYSFANHTTGEVITVAYMASVDEVWISL